MPGFKKMCTELSRGCALGVVEGSLGVSLFSAEELEEVHSLKKLALSVMQKSGPLAGTDHLICEGIQKGEISALEAFSKDASAKAVSASLVAAAEVVCEKSFKSRFREILTGACLNLVGC